MTLEEAREVLRDVSGDEIMSAVAFAKMISGGSYTSKQLDILRAAATLHAAELDTETIGDV